jgi:hypothetical protein
MSALDIFSEFLNEKILLAAYLFLVFLRAGEKRAHFWLRLLALLVAIALLGLAPRLIFEAGVNSPVLDFWLRNELFFWPLLIGFGMFSLFVGAGIWLFSPPWLGYAAKKRLLAPAPSLWLSSLI